MFSKYETSCPPVFKTLEITLRMNCPSLKKSREGTAIDTNNAIGFLEVIDEKPHLSVGLKRLADISPSWVHRIIRGYKFYLYHVLLVQALEKQDYPKRPGFECVILS